MAKLEVQVSVHKILIIPLIYKSEELGDIFIAKLFGVVEYERIDVMWALSCFGYNLVTGNGEDYSFFGGKA